ncbi:MAG: PQQ-binding-like beta-propeller repeat protein [Verrucomicrobiales bacterium]|nr:PQQ-binding-like beta-propeller repeat protein [Verrucomicrobiales bacterium]
MLRHAPAPDARSRHPSCVGWWLLATLLLPPLIGHGADQAQFGHAWSRNMASSERALPARFDPRTGENMVWSARLGTETHSTPVIAGGRILIGTNNGEPRDPKYSGDRGVLLCLNEADGALIWQLVVPKREEDIYFDWPKSGMSSTASVEGDRVYLVDNRGVVLCLDLHGLANGNDGSFTNEPIYYAVQPTNTLNQGAPAAFHPDGRLKTDAPTPNRIELGPQDADIVWMFDLSSGAGIWSHDAAHSSILIRGNHLYLNSGTGVDNTHKKIRRLDAPSLVVLDKRTGAYLARDRDGIGPNIFHSTWAPPSSDGTNIYFAAGNGFVYAYEPLPPEVTPTTEPRTLRTLWSYDFDPATPKTEVHRYNQNRTEGPSNFYGAPVVHDGSLYIAGGGDIWWGRNDASFHRLDLSSTPPRLVWRQPLVRHTFATAAIADGLAFVTDTSQNLHCFETATGTPLWTHALNGETWASPCAVDGKVYVGTRRGGFHVLAATREKSVLYEANLGAPISATPVAANGRLYVATMTHLHAIAVPRP